MSADVVKTVHPTAGGAPALLDKIEGIVGRIRQRAYDLFTQRGWHGGHFDDWLQAEKDLFEVPEPSVTESETAYTIEMAVPGYEADKISVMAERDCVTIHAEARTSSGGGESKEPFTEESKELFRRIPLAVESDPEGVTAVLEKGNLRITIPKAGAAPATMAQAA